MNNFIVNCHSNFTAYEYFTYGLKMLCLSDIKRHYFPNAFLYCGKDNFLNPRKLLVLTRNVSSLIFHD
ncbi:hypothetical protein PR048_020377 [Dryococelus australis]|uniref:Uncharacterized protein n=1 Tax=Dryococelus australis TaxID=614101 RepID=A0ABQ9H646_9NEOP|nr:hypothetical protein PR048_020377 [Dryococelus australis]